MHSANPQTSARILARTLALIVALCMGAAAAQASCTQPGNLGTLESELLTNVNSERAARGLPALRLNSALDKAAQGHACDIARQQSLSHVSADGSKLKQRLNKVGYRYRAAAENIGNGFSSGRSVVQGWMTSPNHRKNILKREVQDIGIGVAVGGSPKSQLYWVINLGSK